MSQKTQGKGAKPSFVSTKKVSAKLSTSESPDVQFKQDVKGLEESFIVLVGGNGGLATVSLTFHRPIGITQLAEDEWVCTEAGQIHYLLARTERPDKQTVDTARATLRTDIAVAAKLLLRDDDGTIRYPRQTEGSRNELLSKARASAKEAALARLSAEQRADPKQRPKVGAQDHLLHLGSFQDAERALLQFYDLEATKRRVEAERPYAAYATRGGPMANVEQAGVAYLKGKNRQQAYDAVLRRIMGL